MKKHLSISKQIWNIIRVLILSFFYFIKKRVLKFWRFLCGWHLPFLIGIMLFSIVTNYVMLRDSMLPFVSDAAGHFIESLGYYSLFEDLMKGNVSLWAGLYQSLHMSIPFIPPFSTLTSTLFYYFFGKSPFTAIMSNSLYVVILVFSVYGIGKYVYNRKVGVLAAFITVTMPGMFALSRTYGADFPLAAMTALSFFFLLLSDGFSNRKYSTLFGVVAGFSFLTRVNYSIFFITIIGLYVLLKFKLPKARQIKNMALAIILLFVIVTPWYMVNSERIFGYTLDRMWGNFTTKESSDGSIPSFFIIQQAYHAFVNFMHNWRFDYNQSIIFSVKAGVSFFYTCIFLLALCYFFFRKKKRDEIMVLGWIFIPYTFWLAMSFAMGSIHRYILPSLPGVALFIASLLLMSKTRRFIGYLVIIFIVAGGLLQFIFISYTIGAWGDIGIFDGPAIDQNGLYKLPQESCKLDSVVDFIASKNDTKVNILVLQAPPFQSLFSSLPNTFLYMFKLRGDQFTVFEISYALYNDFYKKIDYKQGILKSDYIIVYEERGEGLSLMCTNHLREQSLAIEELDKNTDKFRLSARFVPCEGLNLSVYEKLFKIN